MRLALGLGTRPANTGQTSNTSGPAPASHDAVRQRRRFAQDGDVPVVILHRARDSDAGGENKLAILTADLREERAARVKSERALDDANLQISSLKTKLKHAEMALEEKLLGESEARAHGDALLAAERDLRQQAETKAAEAALALSILERKIEAEARQTIAPPPAQPVAAEPVAPAPDLFGEPDMVPVPAAAPKRRMSRKTSAQPEPVAAPAPAKVATAAKPERAPVQAKEQAKAQPADDEDKPIEWWLPSFRAARKTPLRRKRATT